MNNFALLAAVFCVAAATGTHGFPETMLSRLFRRAFKKDVVCSGDASTDVMNCVGPLEFLEHPTTGLRIDSVDSEDTLNVVCGEMEQASQCVENVHSECGQGDMMSELLTRTVVGIVGYMCHPDNKRVILNSKECWENEELEKEINQCGEDVNNSPSSDPCSILSSLRRCMKDKVARVCSAEAANFIDGLVYHAIEPVATDLLHCEMSVRIARGIWSMLPRSRK